MSDMPVCHDVFEAITGVVLADGDVRRFNLEATQ